MPNIIVQRGNPGAGKSTFLGDEASDAATKYGQDKILACSLSRTAARHIGRELSLDWNNYSTIHGAAYRALGSPELAEAHIAEWNMLYPHFALSAHKHGTRSKDVADDSYATGSQETPGDRLRSDPRFVQAWTDWKKECSYLDFDDLLRVGLTDTETAPGEPAVILLDEGQDTSPLAMRLILHWTPRVEKLVIVGDGAQAIFSFLGGDALLFQHLQEKYDPTRVPLSRSYRLSQAVYTYAREWQRRFTTTHQADYTSTDVPGSVQRGKAFKQWRPGDVRRLLDAYPEKDVVFLATCGYMLDPIIRTLREAGIAYHNPLKVNNGKWNALPHSRKNSATIVDKVLAFSRPSKAIWGDDARFWTAADVKAWVSALPVTGIMKRGGMDALKSLSDAVTDEVVARGCAQWFMPETLARLVPEPDIAWYLAQVKGSDTLRDFVQTVIRTSGVRALKDRPRVIVGSIHSYKGGEGDVVIVSPDISKEAYESSRRDAASAEEMTRVFYTATTRAKECLILCESDSLLHVNW